MIISLGSFSLASGFLICASSSFYLLTGTQVEVCSTLIWSHVMNGRKFCSLVAKAWCQFSTKNIVKKKNTAFFFFSSLWDVPDPGLDRTHYWFISPSAVQELEESGPLLWTYMTPFFWNPYCSAGHVLVRIHNYCPPLDPLKISSASE